MPNSKMVTILIHFSRFLIVVPSFMVEYYLNAILRTRKQGVEIETRMKRWRQIKSKVYGIYGAN